MFLLNYTMLEIGVRLILLVLWPDTRLVYQPQMTRVTTYYYGALVK